VDPKLHDAPSSRQILEARPRVQRRVVSESVLFRLDPRCTAGQATLRGCATLRVGSVRHRWRPPTRWTGPHGRHVPGARSRHATRRSRHARVRRPDRREPGAGRRYAPAHEHSLVVGPRSRNAGMRPSDANVEWKKSTRTTRCRRGPVSSGIRALRGDSVPS
jgi:hypothetical protein